MKVYDCFPFFNELDLLEIRLNELYDTVDYFIIVEGERTHQNNPKPLYYAENKARFEKFQDKIVHVVLDETKFTGSPAHNENISYDGFMEGLDRTNAQPEDIVIIGCADEILKPEVITDLAKSYTTPIFVKVHNFCYYLNTQFAEGDIFWWAGPVMSVQHLEPFRHMVKKCLELGRNPANCQPSSDVSSIPLPHGWHFTFMGNKTDVRSKATSYIHAEWSHVTEEEYQHAIDNLLDPFHRTGATSHKFVGMYPVEQLPKYVQNNLEKFDHILLKK